MSSDSQGPPGLVKTVGVQPFAPSLGIKEFVPGGSGGVGVGAKPFIPSGGGATAAAGERPRGPSIGAPSFAPRHGVASAGAAPFIPTMSSAPQPPACAETFGLPEDDDLLGFTSDASGVKGDSELAAQAADMFQSTRPSSLTPQQSPSLGGSHAPMTGSLGFPPGLGSAIGGAGGGPPPLSGGGRGGMGPRPPMSGRGFHTKNSAPYMAGGRGSGPPLRGGWRGGSGGGVGVRGRGGGRGGATAPATLSRPSIAAYAVAPGRMQLAGRYISDTLKQDMEQRSYLEQAQLDPETAAAAGITSTLQQFHSLVPLEDPSLAGEHPSSVLAVTTFMLKGVHVGDGASYALRKFDGRQVAPTTDVVSAGEAAVSRWAPVANHPNIVGLREAFVSDEMDATPSLYMCYDYHPGALTLDQAHVVASHTAQGLLQTPATEEQLWSYLVQLTAALRAAHTAGLAFGSMALAPSKVLLVPGARVRVGGVGVGETLAEGPPADVARAQREDITAIGRLLLVLACAARSSPPTLETLAGHYSRELCHVVAGCLASSQGAGFPNWRAVAATLGDRVFSELDTAHKSGDILAGELQKEYDNGRIARLLIKLGVVLERPELMGDHRWAETGDRYLLKLFRDFVFHQVDEHGAPITDWGPILEALNKADAGIDEKVMLLSRDEASMLVVSYADVKSCLVAAYKEVVTAGRGSAPGSGYGGDQRTGGL